MKKILLAAAALAAVSCSSGTKDPMEARIDEIMETMTLDEKIGQMTQLTIDILSPGGPYHSDLPFTFDEAMMDSVINKYKVGSILNTPGGVAQTPQEWQRIISTLQERSMEVIGIPMVYGVDQIHGTTYTTGGTLFPQGIAMGATFNPELVRRGAEITAYETKATSIPWNFSPVIDLGREARWSRQWETYGEDSHLVSEMGVACVEGYQGADPMTLVADDKVAACLKHFLGYGVPFSGKDRTPSYINEQDMRERHFAPFLEAVRAGALSVMVNSAQNNGLPLHINSEYMTEWLKEDLNWDGLIVTDWADINNIYSRDKIVSSKKEAIKLAINAGIDMSMVPYEWSFCTYLKELVEEGEVPMSRIDDAVRRVLRMKLRLNLFEKPYYNFEDFPKYGSQEHFAAAEAAAEEAITLLKNEGDILPLKKGKKVFVTGPNADSFRAMNGGWSYSWQGHRADDFETNGATFLTALREYLGEENVSYFPGVDYTHHSTAKHWSDENTPEIGKAVAAARASGADYILAFVGENSYCETPGNMNDLTLSENQRNLIKALAEQVKKPIILVLNEGRPRIISEIEPLVAGVIQTYLPGSHGGRPLAKLLYGEANPSGRLPYTYPKYVHSLSTYDFKPSEQTDVMAGAYNYDAVVSVQWAFGYGLSYTNFEYSDIKASATEFTAADTLHFEVEVSNTGDMDGKESVLLFSSDRVASLTPDVRRLRAFSKVEIAKGATQTVKLSVPASDLAFVGNDGKWRLEEGEFSIQIGDKLVLVRCKETKIWNTPNI